MKKNIKPYLLAAMFAVLACGGILTAAFNPYVHTTLNDIQADYLRVKNISFGNAEGDSQITLPTASVAEYANWYPVYNPTGVAIPIGSVLVASATGAGYVNIAPATISLTNVIGSAAAAIPALTRGWMVARGSGYCVVLTTGAVAVGDVLVTSGTVAGRLGTNNAPTTGTDVAVAMTAGVAAGSQILAIMR